MERISRTSSNSNKNFKDAELVIRQPRRESNISLKRKEKSKSRQKKIVYRGEKKEEFHKNINYNATLTRAPAVASPVILPDGQVDAKLTKKQEKRSVTVKKDTRKARKAKHMAGYLQELYDVYDWIKEADDDYDTFIRGYTVEVKKTRRRVRSAKSKVSKNEVKITTEAEDEDGMGGILGVFAG